MRPATRTPEGEPNQCPVCGHAVNLEPSRPPGDAPCPCCGTLLWFTAEQPPLVMTAWDYGTALLRGGNVTAAMDIFQAAVAHKPNDLAQRRALREMEKNVRSKQRADNESICVTLMDVRWEIHQAKHKRTGEFVDWDAIDRAAERGLAVAPLDVELHLELGHACRARGYRDVARFAYQCALEVAPDRADVKQYLVELGE